MKPILSQLNQQQIDLIREQAPKGPFEIDIMFAHESAMSINLELMPLNIDAVNNLFFDYYNERFAPKDHPNKDFVKGVDQFLMRKGFIGKRILANSVERHQNGDTFLGSDLYAIELFKEPIDREIK